VGAEGAEEAEAETLAGEMEKTERETDGDGKQVKRM